MGFFDPNKPIQTGQPDPNFDYKAEQSKLDLKKAMYKKLMDAEMPQGQMVSGHYVAPGWGAQLASVLQKVAGAYMAGKSSDEEKALGDKSISAMQAAMDGPKADVPPQAPVEQPSAVPGYQPQVVPDSANVQTGAVPPPDISVRSAPDENAQFAPPSPAPTAPQVPQDAGPLAGAIAAQTGPADPTASQLPTGALTPDAPTPAPGPLAGAIAATKPAAAKAPTQGEQLARIAQLARTGPMGQAVATQAINTMFGTKGEYAVTKGDNGQFMMFNNKTGDYRLLGDAAPKTSEQSTLVTHMYKGVTTPEQLAQVNKQLVAQGVSPNLLSNDIGVARGVGGQAELVGKERETNASFDSSKAGLSTAITRLDSVLNPGIGQPKIGAGTGLTGSIAAAMPWATDASKVRSNLQEALSQLSMSAMQAMKSAGVGTAAFNSDAEGKRLTDAIAQIDWTRSDEAYLKNKVQGVRDMAAQQMERLEVARRSQVPGYQQAQAGSATGVPARRKSISESDLGGF